MDRLCAEHDALVCQWPFLSNYPFTGSRLRSGREGLAVDYHSDNRHIEYDFTSASLNARVTCLQLLERELKLRHIEPVGRQIAELQIQLHELLFVEKHFELLQDVLTEANLEKAMIKLEKATPCLLHLEYHGSECIITISFILGL